jgi:trans-aconitate 2-methyltransferase
VASRPEFFAQFGEMPLLWNFSGPDETEHRLREAGFAQSKAWLEHKPVTPENPREFARVVTLGPHLSRLPDEMHDDFIDAVLAEMPEPLTLDYVRLNIEARA